MRRVFPVLVLALAAVLGGCGSSSSSPTSVVGTRGIGHVFVIVLENKSYADTFAADSPAQYLARDLPARGAMLTNYYGIGHLSLTNYIAMVSGQAPNPATQTDCQNFTDFNLTGLALDLNGQAVGVGCVYPDFVPTVADQLEQAGYTWKGYMEDMGADLVRDGAATCAHPALNTMDPTQGATAADQYAARHNPFVYFHSIIDDPARCDAHDVPLSRLQTDLAQIATTPNYAFITPNLCHDGHDTPCANGEPGGLASIDDFLRATVPMILDSAAFRQDGLLIITFDEAESDPANPTGSDASACCNELPGPNSPLPGIFGPGGGRIGAVLLSPFIAPGTVSDQPYNHYAMLRSVEDIFGLSYLGYAGQDGLQSFGSDVFAP